MFLKKRKEQLQINIILAQTAEFMTIAVFFFQNFALF